jgi:hypothetical protein
MYMEHLVNINGESHKVSVVELEPGLWVATVRLHSPMVSGSAVKASNDPSMNAIQEEDFGTDVHGMESGHSEGAISSLLDVLRNRGFNVTG